MTYIKKTPEEYLKEPYSRIVIPDKESGSYTAQILEFPGCITEGGTAQEAYERLEEVALSWIEAALGLGQGIPLPLSMCGYGGKVALRLPKSLHRQASMAAERDGTSLNQFIVMALAEKIGTSKFFNYLVEKFESRMVQTAANVANIILNTYSDQDNATNLYGSNAIITYSGAQELKKLAEVN